MLISASPAWYLHSDQASLSGALAEIVAFPCCPVGKESACNVGDLGSIPGLGRALGEGNGISLQYSCLENHMDRGAWQAAVHGVAKSDTTEQLHFTPVSAVVRSQIQMGRGKADT